MSRGDFTFFPFETTISLSICLFSDRTRHVQDVRKTNAGFPACQKPTDGSPGGLSGRQMKGSILKSFSKSIAFSAKNGYNYDILMRCAMIHAEKHTFFFVLTPSAHPLLRRDRRFKIIISRRQIL